MRAYHLEQPGSIDNLKLKESPDRAPARREVKVRVRATSLNYRDLINVRGTYARVAPRPDLIPLSDGAGEIVEVGEGVTRVKPGDRVAGIFMQNWIAGGVSDEAGPSAMGGAIDGMLADTVVLSEDGVVALPPHLSFEEGATLPCAAVTAWAALVTHGALKAGETVLVQGTGGVSIFALQFAKMMGARVIATSSSDTKIARLKEMGADATINYKSHPDWEREVRALTDRRGVDHVVEVGGAGTLAKSLQAVRTGGRISLIGVLTGPAEINPTPIMQRYVTLQGLYVGSRESFEAMNRAIEANGMRPVIDRVFPFADAPAAFRYFETQQHFGKVVIKHD